MEHRTEHQDKPTYVVRAYTELTYSEERPDLDHQMILEADTLEELYEKMAEYKLYNERSVFSRVDFDDQIFEVISKTTFDFSNLDETEKMKEFRWQEEQKLLAEEAEEAKKRLKAKEAEAEAARERYLKLVQEIALEKLK